MSEVQSLFDFLNDINTGKQDLLATGAATEDQFKKLYSPFVISRLLSYHEDAILFVNELNIVPDVPADWHYRFMLHVLRPRKRYGKLYKPEVDENVGQLVESLGITEKLARQIVSSLPQDELDKILKKPNEGGLAKGKTK